MTTIKCESVECKYNENGICGTIDILIDADAQCYTYEPYFESSEYQSEYWIACHENSLSYREKKRGKKIIINGTEFFTQDDIRREKDAILTDKYSGYVCGTIDDLKNNWDTFLSKRENLPDVMTLSVLEDKYDL